MGLNNVKIDQGMLNRYATGHCSEAEILLVEKWLDNESWASIEDGDSEVNKEVGQSIWRTVNQGSKKERRIGKVYVGVAASILFLIGMFFSYDRAEPLDAHTFTNESFDQTKVFAEDHYDVLLSSNSVASIDLINNKISFSGDFVLKPKRDFELRLGNNMMFFKEGREYFVSDSPDFGQVVALQKSDLAFLPPNMQIKIIEQFQDI